MDEKIVIITQSTDGNIRIDSQPAILPWELVGLIETARIVSRLLIIETVPSRYRLDDENA